MDGSHNSILSPHNRVARPMSSDALATGIFIRPCSQQDQHRHKMVMTDDDDGAMPFPVLYTRADLRDILDPFPKLDTSNLQHEGLLLLGSPRIPGSRSHTAIERQLHPRRSKWWWWCPLALDE